MLPGDGLPPDHLLLDSAPNLGLLISRWEINKFKNCWYKSVRILEVLNLLFEQFLNFPSSQRDMSGPTLGARSSNTWSGGTWWFFFFFFNWIATICWFNLILIPEKIRSTVYSWILNVLCIRWSVIPICSILPSLFSFLPVIATTLEEVSPKKYCMFLRG